MNIDKQIKLTEERLNTLKKQKEEQPKNLTAQQTKALKNRFDKIKSIIDNNGEWFTHTLKNTEIDFEFSLQWNGYYSKFPNIEIISISGSSNSSDSVDFLCSRIMNESTYDDQFLQSFEGELEDDLTTNEDWYKELLAQIDEYDQYVKLLKSKNISHNEIINVIDS